MHRVSETVKSVWIRKFRGNASDADGFANFQEALISCKGGYENQLLAKVVFEKTKLLRSKFQACHPVHDAMTIRTMALLGLHHSTEELNVVDFGGGAGAHYFAAKTIIQSKIALNWSVVETDAIVSLSRELSSERLNFFNSIHDAGKSFSSNPNLIFASSSIMYVPNPLQTFESLLRLGADRVFLTRTGFSIDDESHIFVQRSRLSENGPGPLPPDFMDCDVEYPITFVPFSRIMEIAEAEGYRICATIEEERSVWKFGGVEFHQTGLILEKKIH